MFGVVPGGNTIPEGYSKWPVLGADAVQRGSSPAVEESLTPNEPEVQFPGGDTSTAVTTRDSLFGTEYGLVTWWPAVRPPKTCPKGLLGFTIADNWTNCAA